MGWNTNSAILLISLFLTTNPNMHLLAQETSLRLYLRSQEDSSFFTGKELLFLKNNGVVPGEIEYKNLTIDADSYVYTLDTAGIYRVCFIEMGCSKKSNRIIGHYCFSFEIGEAEAVIDTIWAPHIQPYYNMSNGRKYYLFYHSGKYCNGYLKDFYKNTTENIRYEGFFKNGIPRGVHIRYHEDGTVCERIMYSKRGKIKSRSLHLDDP